VKPLRSHLHAEVLECDSTQDEARAAISALTPTDAELQWVYTRAQHRGRGRQGSRWLASDDHRAQLITSVAFKHQALDGLGPLITLAAGHALYRAVVSLDASAADAIFLKWPNDLYALGEGGRALKIAGILSERHPRHGTVIGFGVNLSWQPELGKRATGALAPYMKAVEASELRGALLAALIQEFETSMNDYIKDPGAFARDLIAKLRAESMRHFFQLSEITVMDQLVRPLELRDDGNLEAIALPAGNRIVLR
jgi:biotin-(acetyl-CoA carboxylase) ligase